MQVTKAQIENFRSVPSLEVSLDETTVFIGPNNVGKTAIVDSVRIALTRRWGQRGTGFTEFDVHAPEPDGDPRSLPPVAIQLSLEERTPGDWPEEMVQALTDWMVINKHGANQITLRIEVSWNKETDSFEPTWQWLDAAGTPLSGRASRGTNLSPVFGYVPLFWLGPLRDAEYEFSSRSQHWGRLLKSIKIPDELEAHVKSTLDALDARLLDADPRLARIASTIGEATKVAINSKPGDARLRMLPMNMWDLLARAGIVLRNEQAKPWLPLDHHGQGLQSLSVIFLNHAASVQQVAEDDRVGLEPIFVIEEPELHLHPQAARCLWERISNIPGQKLVTTHSPHFVQSVPLHNLRMVQLVGGRTSVFQIPKRITCGLPWNESAEKFAAHDSRFERDPVTKTLAAKEWFDERTLERVRGCWAELIPGEELNAALQDLRHKSRILVSAYDDACLALAGRRLRGEVFFARRWLLVEGPTEHLLMHAIGRAFEFPLDDHGVAVIDFQNNGNPGVYIALAEAFGIPWDMVSDGDAEGEKFRTQILSRGFREEDLTGRVVALPKPNDLEMQLLADGHEQLVREALARVTSAAALKCTPEELLGRLKNNKPAYMTALAPRISADQALAETMPAALVNIIRKLKAESK